MSVILGIAGASRNAALALCRGGQIVAVCEHERITRTRRAALQPGRLPAETLDVLLRIGGCRESDIRAFAIAEDAIELPDRPVEAVDHHYAHAAAAFLSSPFSEATIIVCDRGGQPELTVWRGSGSTVKREDFPWEGVGLATLYSQAAEAIGLRGDGREARIEALARIAERREGDVPVVRYRGDRLEVPAQFQAAVAGALANGGATHEMRACFAEQLQRQVGDLLVEVAMAVQKRFGGSHLCLGGGLFYNSYFTTRLATGIFERTFVPANPGNAGVSVGAALAVASAAAPIPRCSALSPFLGPDYTPQQIKATLDNCKLSYDYLHNGHVIERAVSALAKGQLVGWFQGRMEWGVRALGNRSILASPVAPYVLENLNVFLKQREPHRTYSVAICEEELGRYFQGPPKSPFMEFEYDVLDRDLLRPLLPANATRLRVQTVPESAGTFYELIRAFGDLTGVPMLVNTSFNGFNEPIVCSPRDAVRVFYGTGLDMAVLDTLVLEK